MKNKHKAIFSLLLTLLSHNSASCYDTVKNEDKSSSRSATVDSFDHYNKRNFDYLKRIKEKFERNPKLKKRLKVAGITSASLVGTYALLHLVTNISVFPGGLISGAFRPSYEQGNYFGKDYFVNDLSFFSKSLGVNLSGCAVTGITNIKNNNIDFSRIKNICIFFYGNGCWSKSYMSSKISSVSNTLYICFDYPSIRYTSKFSDSLWLTESRMEKYAHSVCDYVVEKFYNNIKGKGGKLTVDAWSMGGFPASCLCNDENVDYIYMYSPVCLSGIPIGKVARTFLGYGLNSLEKIAKADRTGKKELKIRLTSGGLSDFLSLRQTLPSAYPGKNLSFEQTINAMTKNLKDKNIDVSFKIFEGNGHCNFPSERESYRESWPEKK